MVEINHQWYVDDIVKKEESNKARHVEVDSDLSKQLCVPYDCAMHNPKED